jgi:hypothetical protein
LGTQRNASGVISRAPPGAAAVALDAAALASFADLQRALSRDADAAGGLNIYICMIGCAVASSALLLPAVRAGTKKMLDLQTKHTTAH